MTKAPTLLVALAALRPAVALPKDAFEKSAEAAEEGVIRKADDLK